MGILDRIRKVIGRHEEVVYERFRDGMGNFEIFYPKGWKYDEDIAVMDGKYSIAFESPDGQSRFNVSVDAQLPAHLDFDAYAKKELESPESGIYTPVVKGKFHGMDAFIREYAYQSGSTRFFGGGVMFFTGKIVFSLSWNAPEKRKEGLLVVFDHMSKNIVVRESYFVSPQAMPGIGTIGISKKRKRTS